MAKKPVKMSKHDVHRLEAAAREAEKSGNKKAARRIRGYIKERNRKFNEREAKWKKEQSQPPNPYPYNPKGPN